MKHNSSPNFQKELTAPNEHEINYNYHLPDTIGQTLDGNNDHSHTIMALGGGGGAVAPRHESHNSLVSLPLIYSRRDY